MSKKRDLPKYAFVRGGMIWMRLKREDGRWKNDSTGCTVDQVEQARRFIAAAVRAVKAKAEMIESGDLDAGKLTVRAYLVRWVKDRETRGIAAASIERTRINKYIAPEIGDLPLEELRPRHVRDMVRALRGRKDDDKLAPRTILHIYGILHNAMESAVVDELLVANPVKVKEGELPKKVDADREWRAQATYTVREVERLISDSLIPVERRVQYALKALTGMRHGEVAALCFRHLDYTAEPLARIHVVQAFDSIDGVVKGTKMEQIRAVPMHPTLAKILASWKLEHWERIYGRKPTVDDYVVPTRAFTCVNGADACHAFHDDLVALGLRVKAGKTRNRGGHDLRSWFKTRCVEDGADWALLRRTTHAPPKDVDGGYDRYSWATICREVGKLKVEILDGEVLPLVTDSLQAEKRASARWTSVVTPKGLEPFERAPSIGQHTVISDEESRSGRSSPRVTAQQPVTSRYIASATRRIEEAIRSGDLAKALRIANDLRAAAPEVVAEERRLRTV